MFENDEVDQGHADNENGGTLSRQAARDPPGLLDQLPGGQLVHPLTVPNRPKRC